MAFARPDERTGPAGLTPREGGRSHVADHPMFCSSFAAVTAGGCSLSAHLPTSLTAVQNLALLGEWTASARFFGAPTPHGLQSTAAMLLLKERVLEADTERFEVQRRMGSGSCTWHPRCPSAFHATPMFVTACVCFHLQTARSGKEPIDAEVTR